MEILNLICNGCAVVFFGFVLVALLATFFVSIYSCFSKKMQGTLLAKIVVAITLGLTCPWVLKLVFFFLGKIIG